MLNYGNLNDVEFEYLCQDIMEKLLGVKLHRFAVGRDGGIDLCDNVYSKNIVVQVKDYYNSAVTQLITSLKKEATKVTELNPNQYYICCSKTLSPKKVLEIYNLFSNYMDSPSNIITLNEIDDFLTKEENIEVLKKHYKLWIESTGVLQNIVNNETFIDCEVLLSTIESDKKFFVQTQPYYKALNCLEKNQPLFIVGNPGVGKTITSKMLVLYYAANGYKVRYTTNTSDLQALKKSISKNANEKEIILIDDCFGQAYFQMKDSQNEELLSLIKFVNLSKNKRLILNSRVTIFQEAKERSIELIKSFENKEFDVHIIDMNAITEVEKAKILYNHLAFNGVEKEYFNEIKKEKRYLKIINHQNYNPRIIEFICNPRRYEKIEPKHYFEFIEKHLVNPKEIWKDEYERKLQKTDRILLSTIYSFSDLPTDQELIKKDFENRLTKEENIDITVNQFEASLNRLLNGFVVIIDADKTQKISMANPSINDYFDARLRENSVERQALINNATHIQQVKRLLTNLEYEVWGETAVKNHTIENFEFKDNNQKKAVITYFIAEHGIVDNYYLKIIHEFLLNPSDIFFRGYTDTYAKEILISLFKDKMLIDFYGIIEHLSLNENLNTFYECFDINDLPDIVCILDEFFKNEFRDIFIEHSISSVKSAIENFCDYIDADDYDPNVGDAVGSATSFTEYGKDVDEYDAASYIVDEVSETVKGEMYDIINKLPNDVIIEQDYMKNLSVSVYGADNLVNSYIDDGDYDPDYHEPSSIDNNSEIDYIFDRDYK